MVQCVANERTTLEVDLGTSEVVMGKCEVLTRVHTCPVGREGSRSVHSTQRLEVAGYALRACPWMRIEVSCKMLDARRTVSLFEYKCGSSRLIFQIVRGHFQVAYVGKGLPRLPITILMPKTWTDIEITFDTKSVDISLGTELVGTFPFKMGHNVGSFTIGDTGQGTDKHIRPAYGVLLETLRVIEEL
jgi:hypothetical protein